jgi:hypothetical protein
VLDPLAAAGGGDAAVTTAVAADRVHRRYELRFVNPDLDAQDAWLASSSVDDLPPLTQGAWERSFLKPPVDD